MISNSEIHRMCRTCLSCDSENILIPLNEKICMESGDNMELSLVVENSISLRVTTNDENFPHLICEKCSVFIRHIYEFRAKCHRNDTLLRDRLNNWHVHKSGESNIKGQIKAEDHRFPEFVTNSFEDIDTNLFFDHNHSESEDNVMEILIKPKCIRNKTIKSETEETAQCSKVFKCDTCFDIFLERKLLLRHRREAHINVINPDYYTVIKEHNKTRYICNICKHFCKHKDHLRVHLRTHTGERPYNCEFCKQTFTGKQHAQQHMSSVHKKSPNAVNYRCRYCSQVCDLETDLIQHYYDRHLEVEKRAVENLCDLCGKFIKDMKDHYRTHAGIRLYECKICGKRMTTASALSQHRQRHSDVKKHQCHTCGKGFKTQYDLTFHRRIHTEEKSHACHLCNKKFLHRQSLKTHLKMHAGKNPNQQAYHQRKQSKRAQHRLEMIKHGLVISKRSEKKIDSTQQSLPSIAVLNNTLNYYNQID